MVEFSGAGGSIWFVNLKPGSAASDSVTVIELHKAGRVFTVAPFLFADTGYSCPEGAIAGTRIFRRRYCEEGASGGSSGTWTRMKLRHAAALACRDEFPASMLLLPPSYPMAVRLSFLPRFAAALSRGASSLLRISTRSRYLGQIVRIVDEWERNQPR